MLGDSGATVLVTVTSLRGCCAGFEGTVLCLDADAEELIGQPVTAPRRVGTPGISPILFARPARLVCLKALPFHTVQLSIS